VPLGFDACSGVVGEAYHAGPATSNFCSEPRLRREPPGRHSCKISACPLARGLTVRHLTLDQGILGSNPSAPATPQDSRSD
jgi:hypothetical protein